MEKDRYITDEEREKCRRVADAYAEFYEQEDIFVADAGRYGFIKLLYYSEYNGFENVDTYTDSQTFFDALWSDWLDYNMGDITVDTYMDKLSYNELLDILPENIKKELIEKHSYFEERAGIEN